MQPPVLAFIVSAWRKNNNDDDDGDDDISI